MGEGEQIIDDFGRGERVGEPSCSGILRVLGMRGQVGGVGFVPAKIAKAGSGVWQLVRGTSRLGLGELVLCGFGLGWSGEGGRGKGGGV